MVMKLTPSLKKTTVQGFDMKCFLIGSYLCASATSHFDILDVQNVIDNF